MAIVSVEDLLAAYSDTVYRKDEEGFCALFDEEVRIFDMWGAWSYEGLPAFRQMVTGWFGGLGADRDVVSFEDVDIYVAGEMGMVTAFVRFAAVNLQGEELRFLYNRLTWVVSSAGGEEWKIVHQHTSSPVDGATMGVLLKK